MYCVDVGAAQQYAGRGEEHAERSTEQVDVSESGSTGEDTGQQGPGHRGGEDFQVSDNITACLLCYKDVILLPCITKWCCSVGMKDFGFAETIFTDVEFWVYDA